MAHALNLTLKIRQDETAKATLAKVKADFATKIQPMIDAALRESDVVHFARVLVIDDLYLQVLTEYDGDHKAYTEFFRQKLPQVFGLLFSLAESPSIRKRCRTAINSLSSPWDCRSGLSATRRTATKTRMATSRATCSPPLATARSERSSRCFRDRLRTMPGLNRENIQGIITQRFAYPLARHFLLKTTDATLARACLREWLPKVTRASDDLSARPEPLINIGITWSGLKALLTAERIMGAETAFPADFREPPRLRLRESGRDDCPVEKST
ncbi:hypothetical protein AJ88_15750 [Mesorhizobium amorphae CCBAU 01583]|nr:hypothetical protein AJ88_15750 [Mesorhizobium amorphae CCBAU 01583]